MPSLGAAFLAAFLLTGCGDDGDYFPLEEGWTWGYRVTLTNKVRGALGTKSVVTNLGEIEIENVAATPRVFHDGSFAYYTDTGDGLLRFAAKSADGFFTRAAGDAFVFKYPLEEGISWEVSEQTFFLIRRFQLQLIPVKTEMPVRYTIEAVDATVRVPAGVFDGCLRIHGTGSAKLFYTKRTGEVTVTIDTTEWYAPGVGLVKRLHRETADPDIWINAEYVKELEFLDRGSWF